MSRPHLVEVGAGAGLVVTTYPSKRAAMAACGALRARGVVAFVFAADSKWSQSAQQRAVAS